MSLIHFRQNGELDSYEVYCTFCGSSIGSMTINEVSELCKANIDPMCFDCDPIGADLVYNELYTNEDHWVIVIDQTRIICSWIDGVWVQQRRVGNWMALAQEFETRLRALLRLSSISITQKPEATEGSV